MKEFMKRRKKNLRGYLQTGGGGRDDGGSDDSSRGGRSQKWEESCESERHRSQWPQVCRREVFCSEYAER